MNGKNIRDMKNIYKIATVLLYALSILLPNACTKNYLELNTDPKTVTADIIDPGLLLTNVEWNGVVGNGSYGNGTYGCFCGMCKRDDDAPFNEQDAPGMWNFSYETMLNNLSNIIQLIDGKSNKDELVNKQAIARILKAWAVANLTDTYGDVPYSESCLPQDQAIYSPKYDTQQSIYTDLFKELKEAAAQLDGNKASYGSADLIYGGDVAKWKKLANSLRLRLALRVRYADAALAQAQLSDLTENDLITILGEDAFILNNTDYPEHLNPRYYRIVNYSTTSESVWTHQVMIDILKNDSINYDPRIKLYADTVMAPFKGGISPHGYYFPPFKYRGSPTLGLVTVNYKYPWGSNTVSQLSDFWRVPVIAPALMRCSEVYFSLAEAKLAGLLPAGFSGSAEQYYQKGIDASIDWYKWFYDLTAPQMPALMLDFIHNPAYSSGVQWTDADVQQFLDYKKIKDAEVANFKSTAMYTLSGTPEEQFEKIINQKIVALYPDEFQGWCEYRRTGYPKVPIGPDEAALHGVVPRREPWPTSEETINSASFHEALARYGTDSRLTKFWWDANPAAPHIYVWVAPTMPTDW
jgi:Starch-binding associating with outer membrane